MKNNQKYMQNRIRTLTIFSWVVLVLGIVLGLAAIVDGLTGSLQIVPRIAAGITVGDSAPLVVGLVLGLVLIVGGVAIFSSLLDQAALLQTALNIETSGDQLVDEVRIMNKYLRQIVPFLKEPPGRP